MRMFREIPEALVEVVEPGDAEEAVPDDQHRPPLAHHLEGLGHRAVHLFEALPTHASNCTGLHGAMHSDGTAPWPERAAARRARRGDLTYQRAFQSSGSSHPTGPPSVGRGTRRVWLSIQVGWSNPARFQWRRGTDFQSRLVTPPSE